MPTLIQRITDLATRIAAEIKALRNERRVVEIEVDFGPVAVRSKKFIIANAAVTAASTLVVLQSGSAATGRQADETEMDLLYPVAIARNGSLDIMVTCLTGRVSGKYKLNLMIG
jgi:hypothetical protein